MLMLQGLFSRTDVQCYMGKETGKLKMGVLSGKGLKNLCQHFPTLIGPQIFNPSTVTKI